MKTPNAISPRALAPMICAAAVLVPASEAFASMPPGSSTDAFDLDQGATVIEHNFQYDGHNVIHTATSPFEPSNAPAFAYDQSVGFQSYIRFSTADTVTLDGFTLLAGHDGGSNPLRRSMNRFALSADTDGDGVYETTVWDQTVNPDYSEQADNTASWAEGLELTIILDEEVIAQNWELRVWQGNNEAFFSGVRVMELDAITGGCIGDDDTGDSDSDGVCDASDNCPAEANTSQEDADGDGLGDACDADIDGDTVPNDVDECPGSDDLIWAEGIDDLTGFDTQIDAVDDDVVLSWSAPTSGTGYVEVWRATEPFDLPSVSGPCSAPVGPSAQLLFAGNAVDFTDVGAAARDYATPTYFYRVLSDGDAPDSVVMAKVTTAAAKDYTKFGLCMLDGVEQASDMFDAFGDVVDSVHLWDESEQRWKSWWAEWGGGADGDFVLPFGGAVSVKFEDGVSPFLSLTGRVPAGEVPLSAEPGHNVLTWPLIAAGYEPLASDYLGVSGADALGWWEPATQQAHWYAGPGDADFTIEACQPYYLAEPTPE